MNLARYREIVPEWEEFREACARPEPTVIRTRTGRIEPEVLRERLEDRGFELRPIECLPHFFRVIREPYRISDTPEHWLGLLYVQQASTGVAAPALSPRPGDRLLDLCAAPGGKTTHLADLTNDRATIVASDRDDKRIRGLLGNLYRMSHSSVVVLTADGRSFPEGVVFDRILVDAPCSAEGNVRRHGGELRRQPDSFLDYVTGLQEALLRQAARLVRPGGSILYATCTFNPEENEAVVHRVLRDTELSVEIMEETVAGGEPVPHAPGLAGWRGDSFHPDLERAWRVYPHHLDSGGLFLCRLRRERPEGREEAEGEMGGGRAGEADGATQRESGGAADGETAGSTGWTRVPPAYPGDEGRDREEAREWVHDATDALARQFGVARPWLERTGWMVRGDSVWGHTLREWPLGAWEESGDWRFLAVGLRVLREDRRFGLRVTNDGLRWMGSRLEHRVLDFDAESLGRLLEGERLAVDSLPAGPTTPVSEARDDGNVALRLSGDIVGRGVIWKGELRHEIPKAKAARLLDVLEAGSGRAGDARTEVERPQPDQDVDPGTGRSHR